MYAPGQVSWLRNMSLAKIWIRPTDTNLATASHNISTKSHPTINTTTPFILQSYHLSYPRSLHEKHRKQSQENKENLWTALAGYMQEANQWNWLPSEGPETKQAYTTAPWSAAWHPTSDFTGGGAISPTRQFGSSPLDPNGMKHKKCLEHLGTWELSSALICWILKPTTKKRSNLFGPESFGVHGNQRWSEISLNCFCKVKPAKTCKCTQMV